MPKEENSLGALPPITTLQVDNLADIIILAYRKSIADLTQLSGEDYRQERNRLLWGYRLGSKVDGVRDQESVELMFKRIVTQAVISYPKLDNEGNMVYCFNLSRHYANKGKSIFGRLSDIKEAGEIDRVGIGEDYDEGTDTTTFRLQAPKIKFVKSNVITVIMSGDSTNFIAWFCGEPRKVYNAENIRELLAANGELDIMRLWVRVDFDYDAATKNTKRMMRIRKHRAHPDNLTNNTNQHTSPGNPPLNPMSVGITAALAEATVELPK